MRYRIIDQDGRHAANVEATSGDPIAMRDAFANMFAGPMRGCITRGTITKQEDGQTRIVPRKVTGELMTTKGQMVFFIAIPQHDGDGK